MPAGKSYVISPEDQDLLNKIRKCEVIRLQSHARRDQLIIQARRQKIPAKIVGSSIGIGVTRVSQIMEKPFTGENTNGKRKAKESDVKESS